MKIRFVSLRSSPDLSPRLAPQSALMAAHGLPIPTELLATMMPTPRPEPVAEQSWESLAAHVNDARRGGPISSAPLRDAVRAVVTELRVGCIAWDEVYAVLDAAVTGGVGPARHPLEAELHASRSAAIVAHMHSWADMQRLAELEDPCAPGE